MLALLLLHMQACGQWLATGALPASIPGWSGCPDPGLQPALPAVGILPSQWRFCSPHPHQHKPVSSPCWYSALIICSEKGRPMPTYDFSKPIVLLHTLLCTLWLCNRVNSCCCGSGSEICAAFVPRLSCHMLLMYDRQVTLHAFLQR